MEADILPADNDRLLKLVKELQSSVGAHQNSNKGSTGESSRTGILYPAATETTEANSIGVIIDDQYSVVDLTQCNQISPPDKLFWVQTKTYDEFKTFLEKRGIPAYISFDGILEPTKAKSKDGLDCAKLLLTVCSAKGEKQLPPYECHCPTITKKQTIEMVLLDYKPKKKK